MLCCFLQVYIKYVRVTVSIKYSSIFFENETIFNEAYK